MSYTLALCPTIALPAIDGFMDRVASASVATLTTAGFAGWLWVILAMPGLLGW